MTPKFYTFKIYYNNGDNNGRISIKSEEVLGTETPDNVMAQDNRLRVLRVRGAKNGPYVKQSEFEKEVYS